MSVIHIWPEESRRQADAIQLSATIEVPRRDRLFLWYKIPESHQQNVPMTSDHFAVGTIFLLMQTGMDAHVHGQVSPTLIRNLCEFQAAWVALKPSLTAVELCADREQEPSLLPDASRAIMTFSGGVDSCFTAFRHARAAGIRFPRNLRAGAMVHGFDIPLEDGEVFASAAERSRRMLSSLGLELITVATNYREVVEGWNYSHGAALASCLRLFGAGFSEGLLAQAYTYRELRSVSTGVNVITDSLLSSDSFRVVSDGATFTRAEKILTMREWPEFLSELRVCWQGPQKDRNCCVCEKCIRNILTFRALGLGLPPCFDQDVSDEQIRTLTPGFPQARADLRYAPVVKLAEAHGVSGPWVRTLEKRLNSFRRQQERKAGVLRPLYRLRLYAGRALARMRRDGVLRFLCRLPYYTLRALGWIRPVGQ